MKITSAVRKAAATVAVGVVAATGVISPAYAVPEDDSGTTTGVVESTVDESGPTDVDKPVDPDEDVVLPGAIDIADSMVAFGAELAGDPYDVEGTVFKVAPAATGGVVIVGLAQGKTATNGELEIPKNLDGKPVVGIDDGAFRDKDLTKVSFADDLELESIGDGAFQGNDLEGQLTVPAKEVGENAFAQNKLTKVTLKGTETVKKDAFRDNRLTGVDFQPATGTQVALEERAFLNNRLSGELDLTKVGAVGNEAFALNDVRSATVGDQTNLGDKVFDKNKGWIELKSDNGSDEARGIVTKAYDDDSAGQVVNPVSVIVRYVDEDGKTIYPEETLGKDLSDGTRAFEKGVEATLTPRKIPNHEALEPTLTFTPDKDGFVVEAKYKYVDNRPVITFPEGGISLENGEEATKERMLRGVTAKDKDGNDLTDKITVDASGVNVNTPGVYQAVYTVQDKDGNERVETVDVAVGVKWADWEFGGGWQIKDFTFNDSGEVTGFSQSGKDKLAAGKTDLWLPPVDLSGKPVTKISKEAFKGTSATKLSSWGNIQEIDTSAFENSKLTSLPDEWPEKLSRIAPKAFRSNQLPSLPEEWPRGLESIGYEAFQNNKLTALPEKWPEGLSRIGSDAFARNQIDILPSKWPNSLKRIERNAFANNKLTSIESWPDDLEAIGNGAFRENQIKSLPKKWPGTLEIIEDNAFLKNKLTSLPEEWPESLKKIEGSGSLNRGRADGAFAQNSIQELPKKWPKSLETIGGGAFANNRLTSLPEQWPEALKLIGQAAFYKNQLTSLPDRWNDQLTRIGYNAFQYNRLTSLPEEWPVNLERIDSHAFRDNQIASLPEKWPATLESIGVEAFRNNKITSLPDHWPEKLTTISYGVFADNQLTSVSQTWPENLSVIGDQAFQNNKITTLPEEWPQSLTEIGKNAFSQNQLSSLPEKWPASLKKIDNAAFYVNQLTALPEEWPESLETIGPGAFRLNKIADVPNKWPDGLKSIGRLAFYDNIPLPSGLSFDVKPEQLTQKFLNDIKESGLKTPIYLFTADSVTPQGLKVPEGVIINPVKVTLNFVDESGTTLAEPVTVIGTQNQPFTYTPPAFFGYETPKVDEVLGVERDQTINVVYKKIDTSDYEKTTHLALNLNNGSAYPIGADMTGSVHIEYTGFDSQELKNPRIELKFDPKVYNHEEFEVAANTFKIDKNSIIRKPGVFSFVLPELIPGQSLDIPFRAKFNKLVTPSNTKFPITATLVTDPKDTNGNQVIAKSNTESFRGIYTPPRQRVSVEGNYEDGVISNYDQKLVPSDNDNEEGDRFVADDEPGRLVKNTLKYGISVDKLERNVSKYEMTVPLPEYKVHEKSETFKKTGPTGIATFDPEANPGWKLSEDGLSVTYVGDNNGTDGRILKNLVLGFPGAVEGESFTLNPTVVLTPTDQSETEPVMVTNSGRTNHFARYTPPPGDPFVKFAAGNHGNSGGNYFYDNAHERAGTFPWVVSYRAVKDYNNVLIRDHDLDSRMFYDSVTVPVNLGDVTVRVLDSRGNDLQTVEVTDVNERKVTFDKAQVLDGVELLIEVKNPMKEGTYGTIDITTRLKNPEKPLFVNGSVKNPIFLNHAGIEIDGVPLKSVKAQKSVRAMQQEIEAYKSFRSYNADGKKVDQLITGDSLSYTVGFKPHEGFGETITNIEVVDLLPVGVDITSVSMGSRFSQLPGARYEVVENYRNSGQTAVIFTASSATPQQVLGGNYFAVGLIDVATNQATNGEYKRIDNEVFVNATGTRLVGELTDPRLGDKKWTKASVWTRYEPAKAMEQRKFIRSYKEDGTPGPWTSSEITAPGAKLDYRLRLINGTDRPRSEIVAYDVFPHVGDQGIPSPRMSDFANTFDPSRPVQAPEGFTVEYYNGPEWPVYPGERETAQPALDALEWMPTPTVDTKAIRITQKQGYTLDSRSQVEFIVPMNANAENLDQFGNPPREILGKFAQNTFFYRDNEQRTLLEGNRVRNELKAKPVSIEFVKTDNSDAPLEGATFALKDEQDRTISTAVSGPDGKIKFENVLVQPGFTVVETQAPKGFVLNPKAHTIDEAMLNEAYANTPAVIDLGRVSNTPEPPAPVYGKVEFTKIDIEGKPLKGTQFTLTGIPTGTKEPVTYTATAGDNGNVVFAAVLPGDNYTLTETQPIGSLEPIDPIKDIKVEGKKTTKLGDKVGDVDHAIVNKTASVALVKLGVLDDRLVGKDGPRPFGSFQALDGERLNGSTFKLYDENNDVVATISPNANADAPTRIKGLKPGVVYRLEETQAPQKYEALANFPMEFSVGPRGELLSADGEPFPVQSALFVPNKQKGQESKVTVEKKDQDGKALAGAEFQLQHIDGEEWKPFGDPVVSDADGVAAFTIGESGRFRVVETKAPNGYQGKFISREFVTDRFVARTFTYTAVNKRMSPVIAKVEFIARALPSEAAATELQKKNPGSVVERSAGQWNVVKYLPGATFEIREGNAEGPLVQEVTTGDDGKAAVTVDIDPTKTYVAVETKVPEGYSAPAYPVTFTPEAKIAEQGSVDGRFVVYAPNTRVTGRIVVSKTDAATGQALLDEKAEFTAQRVKKVTDGSEEENDIVVDGVRYRPLGKPRTENTTKSAGVAVFDKLDTGTYIVRETKAPDGYILDEAPAVFEVTKEDSAHTFVFANEAPEPEIDLTKYINDQDANTPLTAPWIQPGTDTMDVKFVVENTGKSKLEKVTVTDKIEDADDNQQYIDDALKNAEFVVTEADGTESKAMNGQIVLAPGAKATVTLTVKAPETNTMHRDDATAVGYYRDIEVKDEDPAHAYRLPIPLPLPMSGDKPWLIGTLLLGGLALALSLAAAKRGTRRNQ